MLPQHGKELPRQRKLLSGLQYVLANLNQYHLETAQGWDQIHLTLQKEIS